MSEIPLHSIRRNKSRAGYTQLSDNDGTPPGGSREHMPFTRIVAAASRGSSRRHPRNGKGKQRDPFAAVIEEENRLLDNTFDGDDGFDEGGAIRVPVTSGLV
jgi:hypothetical protein